jgi:hypothetical protein
LRAIQLLDNSAHALFAQPYEARLIEQAVAAAREEATASGAEFSMAAAQEEAEADARNRMGVMSLPSARVALRLQRFLRDVGDDVLLATGGAEALEVRNHRGVRGVGVDVHDFFAHGVFAVTFPQVCIVRYSVYSEV